MGLKNNKCKFTKSLFVLLIKHKIFILYAALQYHQTCSCEFIAYTRVCLTICIIMCFWALIILSFCFWQRSLFCNISLSLLNIFRHLLYIVCYVVISNELIICLIKIPVIVIVQNYIILSNTLLLYYYIFVIYSAAGSKFEWYRLHAQVPGDDAHALRLRPRDVHGRARHRLGDTRGVGYWAGYR